MQAEGLTRDEKLELIALYEEQVRRTKLRKFFTFYPDTGPLRRELYRKHLAFFRAGAIHRERLALCANRVGKTEGMGGFETACHITGRYPHWWEGRRFHKPISGWMAGKNNETTRDILQVKMFGETVLTAAQRKLVSGTGIIPGEDIVSLTWKRSSDLLDKAKIKHYNADGVCDGHSILGVKSYEQGRGSFEGTEQEVIWLDEEPPLDIYSECLTRTMTTGGIVLLTFTPLEGMSDVVLSFLPGGKLPDQETTLEAA